MSKSALELIDANFQQEVIEASNEKPVLYS